MPSAWAIPWDKQSADPGPFWFPGLPVSCEWQVSMREWVGCGYLAWTSTASAPTFYNHHYPYCAPAVHFPSPQQLWNIDSSCFSCETHRARSDFTPLLTDLESGRAKLPTRARLPVKPAVFLLQHLPVFQLPAHLSQSLPPLLCHPDRLGLGSTRALTLPNRCCGHTDTQSGLHRGTCY